MERGRGRRGRGGGGSSSSSSSRRPEMSAKTASLIVTVVDGGMSVKTSVGPGGCGLFMLLAVVSSFFRCCMWRPSRAPAWYFRFFL